MKRAFISYSAQDRKIAEEVAVILSKCRIKTSFEIGNISLDWTGGTTLAEQLTGQIKSADIIIQIISENSLNSQWCRREIDYARGIGKKIIPIAATRNIITEEPYSNFIDSSSQTIVWDRNGKKDLYSWIRDEYAKDSYETAEREACPNTDRSLTCQPKGRLNKLVCYIIILIVILLIAYLILSRTGFSKDYIISSNFPNYVYALAIILTLCAYWFYSKRKTRIKLVANKDCTVYADNKYMAYLKSNIVTFITLRKGQYYFSFKPTDEKVKVQNIPVSVDQKDKLILMDFPMPEQEEKKSIKCFIAGSTKLETERNALRSGIAQTHNSWRGKNFEILSYTYEDFERTAIIGGHQSKYDEFIENEATIAIFIISGEIGEFTISEFEKAMNAFINGKHPQILVFNDINAPVHEQSEKLKAMVAAQKQYWVEYDSIKALKLQFMDTLNWMLINIFYK